MSSLSERVETLECLVGQLSTQTAAAERRLRLWRGAACGLSVLVRCPRSTSPGEEPVI
jgi:hypothetical protein